MHDAQTAWARNQPTAVVSRLGGTYCIFGGCSVRLTQGHVEGSGSLRVVQRINHYPGLMPARVAFLAELAHQHQRPSVEQPLASTPPNGFFFPGGLRCSCNSQPAGGRPCPTAQRGPLRPASQAMDRQGADSLRSLPQRGPASSAPGNLGLSGSAGGLKSGG